MVSLARRSSRRWRLHHQHIVGCAGNPKAWVQSLFASEEAWDSGFRRSASASSDIPPKASEAYSRQSVNHADVFATARVDPATASCDSPVTGRSSSPRPSTTPRYTVTNRPDSSAYSPGGDDAVDAVQAEAQHAISRTGSCRPVVRRRLSIRPNRSAARPRPAGTRCAGPSLRAG